MATGFLQIKYRRSVRELPKKEQGVDGILPSEAQSGVEVLGRERSLFAKYT